eukprot:scaffold88685_cov30-Tisochrysis_lutea.AAC.1
MPRGSTLVCGLHVAFLLVFDKSIPTRPARVSIEHEPDPLDGPELLKLLLELGLCRLVANARDEKRLIRVALDLGIRVRVIRLCCGGRLLSRLLSAQLADALAARLFTLWRRRRRRRLRGLLELVDEVGDAGVWEALAPFDRWLELDGRPGRKEREYGGRQG